jgi:hypothetical protein
MVDLMAHGVSRGGRQSADGDWSGPQVLTFG